MTKPTGRPRGGARPGAGRPKGSKNPFTTRSLAERDASLSHEIATLRRGVEANFGQYAQRLGQLTETMGLVLRKLTEIQREKGTLGRIEVPRVNREGREVGTVHAAPAPRPQPRPARPRGPSEAENLREQVFGPPR